MKHSFLTLALLCLSAVAAADDPNERLRRAFPDAAVDVSSETDRRVSAMIKIPVAAGRAANGVTGDPGEIAVDFLEAHGEAIGLQVGKVGIERIDDTAYPVVVRLYDRIGKARVAGSHYIVHVRDGQVSYVGVSYRRARVSPELRKRAEQITEPEPLKAWDAVFADIIRRIGKDPRDGFWWQEGVRKIPMDELPADLIVLPEENLLVYEVNYPGIHAPVVYWVDAETFEVSKPKSPH